MTSGEAGNRASAETAHVMRGVRVMRVIKLGGRAQSDARLPALLAQANAAGPGLIVVHGGGDEVSAMQRRLGLEPKFVGGRRVTSETDLDVVRMMLSGTVNKRIVAQLMSAGARAVGISGEDGGLLTAQVSDPTFGRVGHKVSCHAGLLETLSSNGWLPVISPLARDQDSTTGAGLNVNGDDAAAAIAAAVGADELLFLADVDGVLEHERLVPLLDTEGVDDLVARGIAQGGMRAKLEAARYALDHGVRSVRIGALDAILDLARGTSIVRSLTASKDLP